MDHIKSQDRDRFLHKKIVGCTLFYLLYIFISFLAYVSLKDKFYNTSGKHKIGIKVLLCSKFRFGSNSPDKTSQFGYWKNFASHLHNSKIHCETISLPY